MDNLLGVFIESNHHDVDKLIILVKTVPSIQLSTQGNSVKELRYMEKEFPNLVQRYEINLSINTIGDNADVSDNETRPRI
mgnify:CR=1 FL=1